MTHEQAGSLFQQGLLAEAQAAYEQLLRSRPDDAQAWHMAGAIAAMRGDFPAAKKYSEQAITLRPEAHGPCINLAGILQATGDIEGALRYYARALEIMPGDPQALTETAVLHTRLGDHASAENLLQTVLHGNPQYAAAHNAIGIVYRETARPDMAEKHFIKAAEIQPGYIDAICNLGANYIEQLRFPEAEKCYEHAARLQPGNATVHLGRGNLYQSLGKFAAAEESFSRALSLMPSSPDIRAAYATLQERRGNRDAARELLQPLVASGSVTPDAAITLAKLTRTVQEQQTAISLLRSSLQTTGSPTRSIDLLFSLGELLDNSGDYDAAFSCFSEANDLDTRPVSAIDYSASTDAVMRIYTTARWKSMPRSANLSDLPVFVVGMPRSGTSLVEQILASHPQVAAGGERNDIFTLSDRLLTLPGVSSDFSEALVTVSPEQLDILAGEYLETIRPLCGNRTRFTDKTPLHGILLGFINQLLPRSKAIICKRDPLDTCLSIYFNRFNAYHGYATRLDRLGRFYTAFYRLMDHWIDILDLDILRIQYEDLVSNPEQEIRKMIDFCGLDWHDDCLEFHHNKRVVNTPSYNQVRQPIYTKSMQRWKNYAAHIKPLLDALNSSPAQAGQPGTS